MKDNKYEHLIHAVNNGCATEAERRELNEALESDPELRSYYEFTRGFKDLTCELAEQQPSEGFAARVVAAASRTRSSRIEQFQSQKGWSNVFTEVIPRSKVLAFALAVHAAVLILAAFVVLTPDRGTSEPPFVRLSCVADEAALERASAPRTYLSIDSEGELDVSEFGLSGLVHVVINSEDHCRMLVAFTSDQIALQPRDVRKTATPAFIRDGMLRLPDFVVKNGLGDVTEVAFVNLGDRFEIWDRKEFDRYLERNTIG
ncbi:MAG: hypothetical protein U5N86_10085 [Planctomycetota bacterium]|nr:hypothetical protein [Planctomycetota bacterium]